MLGCSLVLPGLWQDVHFCYEVKCGCFVTSHWLIPRGVWLGWQGMDKMSQWSNIQCGFVTFFSRKRGNLICPFFRSTYKNVLRLSQNSKHRFLSKLWESFAQVDTKTGVTNFSGIFKGDYRGDTGWCGQSWTKLILFQRIGLQVLLKLRLGLKSIFLVWTGPLANHLFNFNFIFLSDGLTATAERAEGPADFYHR